MVHAFKKKITKIAVGATICGLFAVGAFAQEEDPPARVARLNYMQGNVSMEPAGVDDWAPAVVNRPFTTGDYLYTDDGAQAEMHMDIAVMRMGPQTSFGFLNLNDQTAQIKLSEGQMYFRIRNLGPNQVFEVDTPNAAVTLLRDGIYRFNVDGNGNTSYVVVRSGQAEVTGGGQAFTLNPGNSVNLSGTDQLAYDVEVAPGPDQFDNWSSQRDNHEEHLASARYLPPTVIGYEDLDDYGAWQQAPNYGAVWYPRQVEAGWAPYHNGHWAWVEPWGWTWVDEAPWGFAPFHYGRWAYINSRWGWCPGPMAVGVGVGGGYRGPVVRPYYAPALVAFFGGSHFGVSVSIGGGGGASMGWVPLGYGEVYTPPYRVSQNYFRNVNVANTTINKNVNITNVYNTTYVNRTTNIRNTNITNNNITNNNQRYVNMTAPGAVTAMPQNAFASGRSVRQGGMAVTPAQVARIQTANARVLAPPVAPSRQAVIPTAGSRPAARPPQQIMARQVVAKAAPPPPVASFATRQQYLQQHVGQPHNFAAMHQAVAPRATPATAAVVRQAPVARAVQVHPGQRVGNPPPVRAATRAVAGQPGRPAAGVPQTRPGQPAAVQPQARPGQPAAVQSQNRPGQPAAVQPRTRPGEPAARQATPGATLPAGHGTPPNRPGANQANPAARQPATAVQPGARYPGQPAPAARTTAPAQPRATERTQPAAQPRATERTQPAAQPRATERTQPAAQPRATERTQPAAQPRATERTQPAAQPRATERTQPAAQPRATERTQPAAQPRATERTQPAAQPRATERTQPAAQPRATERTQPAARPEHGTPPKRTEKDTDHPK